MVLRYGCLVFVVTVRNRLQYLVRKRRGNTVHLNAQVQRIEIYYARGAGQAIHGVVACVESGLAVKSIQFAVAVR